MTNPLVALGIETPDIGGSFLAGQQASETRRTSRLSNMINEFKLREAQQTAEKQTQIEQLIAGHGAGAAAGREEDVNAIAGRDPELAQKLKGTAQTQQDSALKNAHSILEFMHTQAKFVDGAPAPLKAAAYGHALQEIKKLGGDVSSLPQEWGPDAEAAVQKFSQPEAFLSAKDEIAATQSKATLAETQRQRTETERHNRQDESLRASQIAATNRRTDAISGDTTAALEPSAIDPESGSILAQTGLSMPAYLVLTGKASTLPRDRATRDAAFTEARNFANKNNVDVSTLASQFTAQNETLQKNIQRANQTRIMENEIGGTIDNLKPVADAARLGKLRIANVARVWAGQETNDPIVQQYSFQLNQLRSELAAYNGALQGRTGNGLTVQDYNEAERVIKSGLSSGAADGLKSAVAAATEKMGGVMNQSIDTARKGVWDLFGVGGRYKPKFAAPTNKSLPQPKTPEEAMKLPPGTRFLLPDGSGEGVVPGGR